MILAVALIDAGCDLPSASAESDGESTESSAREQGSKKTAESDERGPEREKRSTEPSKRTDEEPRADIVERALDPTAPLPDAVREALSEIEFGPRTRDITRDSHYWVSNEKHHHLYRPHIEGLGGILMGVGTDQNYLMAGWSKSPILLMVDFDEQIRNVHHLYGLVFQHVDSPEVFIRQWSDENVGEIRQWIEGAHEGDEERIEALKQTLEWSNDSLYYRLRTTAEQYDEAGIPCFLTSSKQFEFVQGLWERGRVFPIRGDLTGDEAMVDIASTLREFGLEIGVLYVSNAEQYFKFTPEYRRNIAVQPFRDDAVVLRTRPMEALGLPKEGDYHYNVQRAKNFVEWLRYNRVEKVSQLMLWYKTDAEKTQGLSFIRKEAPRSEPAPELADVGAEHDLEPR